MSKKKIKAAIPHKTELEKWLAESEENRHLFRQEGLILSVTEGIWSIMQEEGIKKADLARKLKCSKAHITQLLDGTKNMTLRTLSDIAHAMGAHPVIFFYRVYSKKK